MLWIYTSFLLRCSLMRSTTGSNANPYAWVYLIDWYFVLDDVSPARTQRDIHHDVKPNALFQILRTDWTPRPAVDKEIYFNAVFITKIIYCSAFVEKMLHTPLRFTNRYICISKSVSFKANMSFTRACKIRQETVLIHAVRSETVQCSESVSSQTNRAMWTCLRYRFAREKNKRYACRMLWRRKIRSGSVRQRSCHQWKQEEVEEVIKETHASMIITLISERCWILPSDWSGGVDYSLMVTCLSIRRKHLRKKLQMKVKWNSSVDWYGDGLSKEMFSALEQSVNCTAR